MHIVADIPSNIINLDIFMQMISTPTLSRKFLHLEYLHISLIGNEAISPDYDYLSLVSFLEASPRLETFILEVGYSHLASIPSTYGRTTERSS